MKFDSDSERYFPIILEDDADVVKWLKPPKDLFKIQYADEDNYNPDFIVETANARYLCEIKLLLRWILHWSRRRLRLLFSGAREPQR